MRTRRRGFISPSSIESTGVGLVTESGSTERRLVSTTSLAESIPAYSLWTGKSMLWRHVLRSWPTPYASPATLSVSLSVCLSFCFCFSLSLSVYSMRCIVDASCSASTLPSSFTSWTQYYNNTTIACLLIMLYRTSRLWSSSDIGHSRSVNTSWSILSKNLTTKDMYVNSSRHVSPEIWRTAVELKSMCIHSDRDIWNLNTIIEIRREKNTVLVSLSNKWRRLVDCAVSSQQKHHIARNDLRCVCLVSRTNAQNENTYIKTKQVTNCVYDLSGH